MPGGFVLTVTSAWIREFGTDGQAWNAKQLEALGIKWPPAKGQIFGMVGMQISDEAKQLFEYWAGKSKHQLKVTKAKESGELDAVYITTPDGKGSWTGRWGNEKRWNFSR